MKRSALVLSLVLSIVFAAWGASPATAKPVPGIKQTAQYRVLLGFVDKLEGKKRVPATPARKAAYRKGLASKAAPAKRQVKSLFQRRSKRVKSRDDAEQRRQIRNIRINQKRQVSALKAVLASKLADLQDDYNAAVRRTDARFAPILNPQLRRRAILKRQLANTIRPAKRQRIQKALRKTQGKINRIVDQRQAAINVVTAKYQARISAVDAKFEARIRTARSRGQQLVLQARRAWRQTYRADLVRLQERRTEEFELVSRLRARGAGYIDSMPNRR